MLDLRVPWWHALVFGRHGWLPVRIAEAGQLDRKSGRPFIAVLSTHGSQSPYFGSSQLPQRIHFINTCCSLVLHLLTDILRNMTSCVISPPDRRDQDMVQSTPNSGKNPRTATTSPGDDDGSHDDSEENPGDTNDEKQHEKQHGDWTENPIQRNKRQTNSIKHHLPGLVPQGQSPLAVLGMSFESSVCLIRDECCPGAC